MSSGRVGSSSELRSIRKAEHHDATAPLRSYRSVSLTAANIATQYASTAAAISASSGFTNVTLPTASRLPQVVVADGGAANTFTLMGTALSGEAITQELSVTTNATGNPVTTKFSYAMATVTSFSSSVAIGAAVDLQWGDTWVEPPARAIIVGTAGNVAMRGADDDVDGTIPVQKGINPMSAKIIRITNTTAADVWLGW